MFVLDLCIWMMCKMSVSDNFIQNTVLHDVVVNYLKL